MFFPQISTVNNRNDNFIIFSVNFYSPKEVQTLVIHSIIQYDLNYLNFSDYP